MSDVAANACVLMVEVLIPGPQGPAGPVGSGGSGGLGPHAVVIANAAEGDVIAFSGAVWENRPLPPAGDMTKAVYDTDGDGKVDAAEVADSVAWAGVADRPETFPPAAHAHAVVDVTGLGDALAVYAPLSSPALVGTPTAPTAEPGADTDQLATTAFVSAAIDGIDRSWDRVTGKPETFPPAAHGHAVADIAGLGDALAAKADASVSGALTVLIRDAYRQSVEAASGGVNTVLYDDAGNPSVMYVLPRFNLEDVDASLGTGAHPAFIVNGVSKREIFIGKYLASVIDGRAVSMPGVDPAASINFDNAHARCTAKGPGWHLMTNAEWAAIALWAWKNGHAPRGNTNWGRSHERRHETGRRGDGLASGDTGGAGRTQTGSGPAGWSHDGTPAGIIDLVGNVWEWQRGLRLNNGEIQIIPDNNAADPFADHGAGSAAWRAILRDGSLVAPGTPDTLKLDATGAAGAGAPILNIVIASQSPGSANAVANYAGVTASSGVTAPALLKAIAVFPHAATASPGQMYINNAGERLTYRGGSRGFGGGSGFFALGLSGLRSDIGTSYGFRPAYVI